LYAATFDAAFVGRGIPVAQLAADEPGAVEAGVTPTGLQNPPEEVLGSQRTALAVSDRERSADPAIGPGVADQARETRVPVARQIVVTHLAAQAGGEIAVIERPSGAQIDGRAQRALVHFRRLGFTHGEVAEQFGGEDVEIETAPAVGAARTVGAAGGGQRFHTVEPHPSEIRAEAAHGDRTPLARVAVDRHARNALQRFGKVLIGKLADVLGDDGVDLFGRIALLVEGFDQAGAETDHLDRVQVLRRALRRLGRGLARLLRGGGEGKPLQGQANRSGQNGNRCLFSGVWVVHRLPLGKK
jgi:hypothetical protein